MYYNSKVIPSSLCSIFRKTIKKKVLRKNLEKNITNFFFFLVKILLKLGMLNTFKMCEYKLALQIFNSGQINNTCEKYDFSQFNSICKEVLFNN